MVCATAGKLGNIDANMGDPTLGWDTDQFPTDINPITRAMLVVLEYGGMGTGGLNFDAKVRRGSLDTIDLFYAHIGGMDTFARGLLAAQSIIDEGQITEFRQNRYVGWDKDFGKSMLEGKQTLESMEAKALELGEPKAESGRQEMLENILISAI